MPRTVAAFVPLKKAAELAGLDRRQLRHLADQGRIATSTIPGSIQRHRLYRREDLIRLREAIERGFQGAGTNQLTPAVRIATSPRRRLRSRLVA